ncbi:hexitol phosphatase HxpB [Flammeovirgaceae bacterium SG7u.111]|nr:hexitol phosphatase HxpB [Flammeovirgaceae bacterium SG7u.132]WPO34575.1 hexitol phosphatase HxpB [Flammeovirgaceae bacterium SG7u.111]
MLKAVIFDMDGLLIDSEPHWSEAATISFAKVGVKVTDEIIEGTFGMRTDESVAYVFKKHSWEGMEPKEMEGVIVKEFLGIIQREGKLMPGAEKILHFFKEKGLRIGLASSSPLMLIEAMTQQMGIRPYFEVVSTAENEEYGKPHPAVYISTAVKLGVKPSEALAFEDSFTGLLAAKSGRLKTVVVPDHAHFDDPRFSIADLQLRSLTEFTGADFERLNDLY